MREVVTLGQLSDDYFRKLTLSGRSDRTIAHYRDYIENFMKFAAEHGVSATTRASKIDRDLLQGYQVHLAERPSARDPKGHISVASRNLYAVALRGLLRHGVTDLKLQDLPAPDTVVIAKVGEKTMRRMEVDDFQALLEALPKTGKAALRDRAVLEVLFATGCRLSELCTLTRRRVNLKTREVEVLGKGKKVRGTFLTEEAAKWLERYLATRKDNSPFLFVSNQSIRHVHDRKTGEKVPQKAVWPMAPRTVQALVERLSMKAGLPEDFSPHWFRHGRLTIVARHAGLLAAQELAGHASPNTTRRYTRITSAELKRHFDDSERLERGGGL
jgi:site-specific recombinase XerD